MFSHQSPQVDRTSSDMSTDTKSVAFSDEKKETKENVTNEEELYERNIISYNYDEELNISDDKDIILTQINKIERRIPIYENQEECSLSIMSKLHNRKIINIMVLALTQSGKTGTMCALIKNYVNNSVNIIPIENIYIITGLSSNEWVAQTKDRMPQSIHNRIFHRGNLNKSIVNEIKDKKNILIIIDEIQVAAKEKQSLYHFFNEAGFYNKQKLFKNDVKIVEFTATPDGTIYDLMNWGDNACKIQMFPGYGYTSCFDLYNNGKVKQHKDLCCYNKNSKTVNQQKVENNFQDIVNDIDSYDIPLYHIIRTPNGELSDIVINNFKKYYDNDLCYHKYEQGSQIEDINNLLKKQPLKHTFIFIKEKMRCAKTLTKTYLGVVYERPSKQTSDTVIIQGLVGRLTGYDNNQQNICYTNISSIEKYKKLWDSNFEDTYVDWKSGTTKLKKKCLVSKGTYNIPPTDGTNSSSDSSDYDTDDWFHEWVEFSYSGIENQEQHTIDYLLECVNNWIKDKPSYKNTKKSKRGNKYKMKNEIIKNGNKFYKSSYKGEREILSYDEVMNFMINIDKGNSKKTTNLSKRTQCRTYVTYKDSNDHNSIVFITRYLEQK